MTKDCVSELTPDTLPSCFYSGVPKNEVWRSKRLLKPQPTLLQCWGLELRTSLTKAGDGAKCGAKFAET